MNTDASAIPLVLQKHGIRLQSFRHMGAEPVGSPGCHAEVFACIACGWMVRIYDSRMCASSPECSNSAQAQVDAAFWHADHCKPEITVRQQRAPQ